MATPVISLNLNATAAYALIYDLDKRKGRQPITDEILSALLEFVAQNTSGMLEKKEEAEEPAAPEQP